MCRAPAANRSPPARARRGFTLAELVVALGLGGVTFGAFALVVAKQERSHAELAAHIRARSQLSEGLAALVVDLRGVSPRAGDIPPGGARDSSLEFRATIGTLTVCEVAEGTITGTLESFVTAPELGDTAWVYVGQENGLAWVPLPIAAGSVTQVGLPPTCVGPAAASSLAGRRAIARHRHVLTMAERIPLVVRPGTPVRVTRRVRYSLYRAPGGQWHLGRREWSPTRGRFESIQPMSGPYREYAVEERGSSGLELRYLDELGAPLSSGTDSTHRVAAIAITLRAPPTQRGGQLWPRRDAMAMTLALRNRS